MRGYREPSKATLREISAVIDAIAEIEPGIITHCKPGPGLAAIERRKQRSQAIADLIPPAGSVAQPELTDKQRKLARYLHPNNKPRG